MKQKNENKIILKQWVQVFIILIILATMAFAIWAIVRSVSHDETQGEELYNYNYNSNISYRVYLKQNEFFTTPYLGMNKQYITSLIDRIEVDTKYNFQSSKDLDYTYSYDLVATAKGTYSESDSKSVDVWSKAYTILPSETKTGTGKTISVNKTVTIDYNKYNQIMTDFRNKFGLSVDARVDVAFKINVTGGMKGAENTLQESNVMTLQIPLLKPTIEIKPDYVNHGNETVYKTTESDDSMNIPLLIFGAALLIFTLVLLKIFVSKLLATTKKSEYVLKLNKILKEYGDIIAEADNMPDLTKYDVVNIKQFNDLVDIEEELHSPIICNEIREDLESWFLIFHNETAYRFILKYEDFNHLRR